MIFYSNQHHAPNTVDETDWIQTVLLNTSSSLNIQQQQKPTSNQINHQNN